MFESYFNQIKSILRSKDGKDKKLEKIELLTGLVDGMQPTQPRYNLPTSTPTSLTQLPVASSGISSATPTISTGLQKTAKGQYINANGNDVIAMKKAAANAVKNTPKKS